MGTITPADPAVGPSTRGASVPSLSLNPFKALENLLDRDGRHLGRKGEVVDDMIELRRKIDAYESGQDTWDIWSQVTREKIQWARVDIVPTYIVDRIDEVLEVIDPRRGEDWRDRDIALSTLDRLVTDQIRINTCPDAGLRQLKQLKYWRDGQWKRYPLRAESSRLPER